ncbi:uncharacterized protein LOC116300860 [Actinia tenebrosa]|uniref:Uncharacterized protein LOC116300860 n=1 Tax=Actinia tenebrosa TaxID=6105 RepID=A0A6P8IG12_ACTTE|nr:uncharacterized protein LOC116300860 [Actinia tenebrosa]
MKKAVSFSLILVIAAISTQVEGEKRKPLGTPTSPPKTGWRFGNGPCMCNTSTPKHKTHQVHPTAGHHPSGPHGPQMHHPSKPHGHHPSPGPHGPSMRPRRNGPQGHHHKGSHPTRRPIRNHRQGGPKKHQRGPHHRHGPKRKQETKVWRKCVCRKPADKGFKIKFRMMKKWLPDMANPGSKAYRRLTDKINKKLSKVLKTETKSIYNMRFTKGSIVAEFEVKESEITKDPEKALRHSIYNGQLKDLEIQPESLVVQESYSGVKLSEWKTDESECHRCHSVTQTRECTEVTASCDGIPLTRNASCYDACPPSRTIGCGGYSRFQIAKVMLIVCLIVGVLLIVAALVVIRIKRARRNNLKESPSTSSFKPFVTEDNHKLQSKC